MADKNRELRRTIATSVTASVLAALFGGISIGITLANLNGHWISWVLAFVVTILVVWGVSHFSRWCFDEIMNNIKKKVRILPD